MTMVSRRVTYSMNNVDDDVAGEHSEMCTIDLSESVVAQSEEAHTSRIKEAQ